MKTSWTNATSSLALSSNLPDLSPDQATAFQAALTGEAGKFLFVTGEAGTGKSTVLRQIVQSEVLECAVLAPTGLAALNVAGQTIHSFFGFKLGPLEDDPDLMHMWKRGAPKHRLVSKLAAIIIDEISMVRADVLDAIDFSLRTNLQNSLPFGGKTVIAFGDLWQLEPVVGRMEAEIMSARYASQFFFDSRVIKEAGMDVVALKQIHRQQGDPEFMHALNALRRGSTEFLPYFNQQLGHQHGAQHVLILTATNQRANTINMSRLAALSGVPTAYAAAMDGDFGRETPADPQLILRPGAQVMFVKNGKEWVNGSLGTVIQCEPEAADVQLEDGKMVRVERETWEKTKYGWDRATERITREPVGTFTQLPLRLAWAVTIHKAQGLTFDHLTVDLDRPAFSHGQIYVALSRCRTIQGLSLVRELKPEDVIVHPRIWEFERMIGLS